MGKIRKIIYGNVFRCPWNSNTTSWAVVADFMDIYEWAIENGCKR